MGLFGDIVGGLKSAASAVVGAVKATGSAVKTAAVATVKTTASAANTVSEYFKGAQETVANYIAAHEINSKSGPEFTLEMRQKALKYGPVGSFPYNMQLSNLWLIKNPEAVVSIGSVGKAGTTLTKVKGGGYLLDFAKSEASQLESAGAKGIKNVAGFATSQAKKLLSSSGLGSTFKGIYGKILATGGLIVGTQLAITNTVDFYAWQNPIQTWLKQKFPGLFPPGYIKGKVAVIPKIVKMTPAETKQLQQIIFEKTGLILTGEELRQAILEEFGITVLEIAPTKGNTAGPLAAGGGVNFQQSIKQSTNISTIKPTPNYMISNQDDLQYTAMNEIAAFVQALPSRMSFNFVFKKSYKDADGVTRKGNFAFMQVKVTTKTGGQSTLAEIPLGTTPPEIINPGQLNATIVNSNIQSQLGAVVTPASLPAAQQPTATTPTPPVANISDVAVAEDGQGKYIVIIPAVAGATRNHAYRFTQLQLNQFGLKVNSSLQNLQADLTSAGSIAESINEFAKDLQGHEANLYNQRVNAEMDRIAAAHRYDTNYTPAERKFLETGKFE